MRSNPPPNPCRARIFSPATLPRLSFLRPSAALACIVCHRVARVPAYLSINPGLLDSVDHWSYRDLQKLAKRLQLSSTGKRESVVNRLKEWHREQRECGQAGHFRSVEVRASAAASGWPASH